ncbi:TPA: hypothetical protein ACK3SN_008649, partial [Burkholderia cepacia]
MHTLFKKTTVTMAVSSLLALYGCGSVDGPTTPPTIKPSTSGTGGSSGTSGTSGTSGGGTSG